MAPLDSANADAGMWEVKEVLSETEERFERVRNTVGLFLGPLVMIALLLTPMPGISAEAHTLAGILGLVVIYWVTEPIPIPMTSLLGPVLVVMLGVAPAATAFGPFADPTIFLFLGSFIIAESMMSHGLDRRFAYGIMSFSWVGGSTGRILIVYGAASAFISAWISNTATAAMMFPIGLGIVRALSEMISEQTGKKVEATKLRFATGIMLMAAYASSVGGIATPVGTPPNIIGIAMIEKFTGVKIAFFEWMLLGYPLAIIMFVVLFVVLYFLFRPEVSHVLGGQQFIREEQNRLGRWTRGQRNTLVAFGLAVTLWVIPGFLAAIFGSDAPISRAYSAAVPESVAVLIAAGLLFVMPVNWREREFTMNWSRALRIDWGTLLLFGGGLSMGKLMFDTKLAESIGVGLLKLTGANDVWSMTFAAIAISILLSEATSNTAAANMVIPVMIALAQAGGINPLPPAIGATIGASWGFMLPVSTPPNAIVYGSGMVPITKMIKAGIIFDIVGAIFLWVGLRIILPMLGLG